MNCVVIRKDLNIGRRADRFENVFLELHDGGALVVVEYTGADRLHDQVIRVYAPGEWFEAIREEVRDASP